MLVNEEFIFPKETKKSSTVQYELILNHHDYDVTLIDVPPVPENEMRQALEWEAKKIFSDYEGQLLFDYYPQPFNNPSTKQVVNIVSVERKLIDQAKDKAKSDGINLKKISIPEVVYKQYVARSNDSLNQCLVIANEKIGKVIIFNEGDICFSRRFNLIYKTISSEAGFDQLLLLELQRSLDYFERQYRLPLPKSYFVISDVESKNLDHVFRENIGQHVSFYTISNSDILSGSAISIEQYFLLNTIKR